MSTASFLLQGVLLADGVRVDVEVDKNSISRIGSELQSPFPIIEGSEGLLLPGLVDLHTHLREPGKESSETVLTAA